MNAPDGISTPKVTVCVAALALAFLAAVYPAGAARSVTEAAPARLVRASTIRTELNVKLEQLSRKPITITEPITTDIVESFVLLSADLLESRYVQADNGLWYQLCAAGTPCISPAPRRARPAADLLPRRLALELALRSFIETDADVVAVSLPTPRLVVFVVSRVELAREIDVVQMSKVLARAPMLDLPATLRRTVDELTRPRTFLFLGIEPGVNGGPSWGGMPRWPSPRF